HRLMILGLLAQNLDADLATEDDIRCKKVIHKFTSLLADPDSIKSLVDKVPRSFETKFFILKSLIQNIEPFTDANPDYQNYLKNLKNKLKLDQELKNNDSDVLRHYLDLNSSLCTNPNKDILL